MTVKRMDNVGIVVEDIDAAIEFFTELGLELEGRVPIEGDWADGVTGLCDMRVEIAIMRTPDGHSRLELSFETGASLFVTDVGSVSRAPAALMTGPNGIRLAPTKRGNLRRISDG